jgi:uncharacterized repeat protein (TIGR01451 family)
LKTINKVQGTLHPKTTDLSKRFRCLAVVLMSFFVLLTSGTASAQNIQLYKSYAGNLAFKLNGNSLRNATNECQALTQSSSSVSIPAGSTLKAAYLYWSGSGQQDTSVTLNGSQVNASVTYNLTVDNRNYFSSRADVTSRISANSATYTVGGLTFDTSQSYCDVASVYGGWALLTIFENSAQPLRVINVFDGFRDYYGSSITLTPNNFVVSDNPSLTQGQHAHITWEGDAGNSQALNNVSEALTFNGSNLTDSGNPAGNQFNSYSNTSSSNTSGVDLDTYQIGNFLQPGQTSVSTTYSSGQDRVFLTAEIISIPNEAVSDLSIDISTFETTVSRGSDITYSVSMTNQGPSDEPPGSVITIPLGTETSFVSASGTNWNCNANATDVICTYNSVLGRNNTSSSISLLLSTTGSSEETATTTATVEGVNFDNNLFDNTDSVNVNIEDADFSSSIKSVVDVNGGLLYPGDTLRYTIDLINNSNFNANNVTLTDSLPQYISGFEVVRQPSGSTNNSQLAPAGSNNNGLVVIENMTIAANGSEELVIDAVVSNSAPQGGVISNTASISSGASTYNITSPSISIASQSLANGEIVLRESLAGNLNYELLGGAFRQGENGCSQPLNSVSDSITLPAGSTVKAAYLYWSGSGNADNTATLNGASITAGYTYEQSYQIPTNNGGTVNSIYYSSRANVTSRVNGSGTYTVSGVNFNRTQTPYCDYSTAYAGWAMLLVYENASEPLRVVNLYDGFKSFRGDAITLNPDNFIIAQNAAALGAKHAHITWEGDAGNSENFNGRSEALVFENNSLTDNNNPANNQFNSYSNTIGNTSGVDIDDFNIGQYLTPGETSVTTTYSSGQDLVFLTAEVISIPNEPVSDMTLRTSAPARVSRGATINYNFTATNNGPLVAPAGSTITLPLNDGATFEGFSGTNWNCTASTSQVICTFANAIPVGSDAPPLSIIFGTSNTTQGAISGDAVLDGVNFDNNPADNIDDLTVILQDANLSASTKSVLDLNGGQVLPGDTLRYTLTITNSSNFNATNINLTDHMPALISSYNIFQRPASSTDNSQPAPAGDNNTGVVVINDLSITSGASISVIIDAVISAGAQDGQTITNTAVIGNPATNYSITSPTVTINNAFNNSGNKPLYLQSDATLTRIADTTGGYQTVNDLQSITWGLSPALQTDVSLDYSQPIPVTLRLQNNLTAGQGNNNEYQHDVTVSLRVNRSGAITTIASASQQVALLTASNTTSPDSVRTYQFNMAINNAMALLAGDVLQLVVAQSRIGGSVTDFPQYRLMRVYSSNNGVTSLAALTSNTVINVESVTLYDDTYPNGNQLTTLNPGRDYYVRADITDPFGAYDVTNTRITINGPSGETPANLAVMSAVNTTASTLTVEYPYSTEPDAVSGDWGFKVRADEGYEGTVFNELTYTIPLVQPAQLTLQKSMDVINDPVNGTSNPKAIPGARIEYTLTVSNAGEGTTDTDSIAIVDKLATGTDFYVGTDANVSPISLVDGNPASNLTLTFENLTSTTDDVEFSNDGGLTFGYQPTPDANGFDPLITDFRIAPTGTMPGSDVNGSPVFNIFYQVKVQ